MDGDKSMISKTKNAKRIADALRHAGFTDSDLWVHEPSKGNLFIRLGDDKSVLMGFRGTSQMVHSILNAMNIHVEFSIDRDKEVGYFMLID